MNESEALRWVSSISPRSAVRRRYHFPSSPTVATSDVRGRISIRFAHSYLLSVGSQEVRPVSSVKRFVPAGSEILAGVARSLYLPFRLAASGKQLAPS